MVQGEDAHDPRAGVGRAMLVDVASPGKTTGEGRWLAAAQATSAASTP